MILKYKYELSRYKFRYCLMNIHLQGKVISQAKIYLFGNCLELKTPINDKDLNPESISFVSIFA